MQHPALISIKSKILFLGICILIGMLYALSLVLLTDLCFGNIILHGMLSSVAFGLCTVPLWMVVQFTNRHNNSKIQHAINTISIGVLFMIVWLIISLGVEFLLVSNSIWLSILNMIPLQIFIGTIAYAYCFVYIKKSLLTQVAVEQSEEIPTTEISEASPTAETEILERVSIKQGQKIKVIAIDSIDYIASDGDYVMIYTADGKYLKEQTMKYFQTHLPQDTFVRIHRSYIVNIHAISGVQLLEKQSYIISLKNGTQLKASLGGYKNLKLLLQI